MSILLRNQRLTFDVLQCSLHTEILVADVRMRFYPLAYTHSTSFSSVIYMLSHWSLSVSYIRVITSHAINPQIIACRNASSKDTRLDYLLRIASASTSLPFRSRGGVLQATGYYFPTKTPRSLLVKLMSTKCLK